MKRGMTESEEIAFQACKAIAAAEERREWETMPMVTKFPLVVAVMALEPGQAWKEKENAEKFEVWERWNRIRRAYGAMIG